MILAATAFGSLGGILLLFIGAILIDVTGKAKYWNNPISRYVRNKELVRKFPNFKSVYKSELDYFRK